MEETFWHRTIARCRSRRGSFRRLATTALLSLLALLGPVATIAQAGEISVRVVEFDRTDRTISSDIVILRTNGTRTTFRYDRSQDPMVLPVDCQPGDLIEAHPDSTGFYHSQRHNCRTPLEIRVISVARLTAFATGAAKIAATNPSKAALLYNEAYARASIIGLEEGETYRIKALESAAAALEVEQGVTLDRGADRYVASQKLVDGLREFQLDKNIEVTGRLDSPTLRELSGSSIGGMLEAPIK